MQNIRLSLGSSEISNKHRPAPTIVLDMPQSLWNTVYKAHEVYRMTDGRKDGGKSKFYNTAIVRRPVPAHPNLARISFNTQVLYSTDRLVRQLNPQRIKLFSAVLLNVCQFASGPRFNVPDKRVNLVQEQVGIGATSQNHLRGIAMAWPIEKPRISNIFLSKIATDSMTTMAKLVKLPDESKPEDSSLSPRQLVSAEITNRETTLWTNEQRQVGFRAAGYDPRSPGIALLPSNLHETGPALPAHLLVATVGALTIANYGESPIRIGPPDVPGSSV
jgi:hypothetical protein